MERLCTALEREGEALEVLLFKLIETKLLLQAGEARFLPRATGEVERARAWTREVDLLRATTVSEVSGPSTLREIASKASGPWPAILRDHHGVMTGLLSEIEVVGHQNGQLAHAALTTFERVGQPVAAGGAPLNRPVRDAELDRLARGAALDAVQVTATRLMIPDLIDFLR